MRKVSDVGLEAEAVLQLEFSRKPDRKILHTHGMRAADAEGSQATSGAFSKEKRFLHG